MVEEAREIERDHCEYVFLSSRDIPAHFYDGYYAHLALLVPRKLHIHVQFFLVLLFFDATFFFIIEVIA